MYTSLWPEPLPQTMRNRTHWHREAKNVLLLSEWIHLPESETKGTTLRPIAGYLPVLPSKPL